VDEKFDSGWCRVEYKLDENCLSIRSHVKRSQAGNCHGNDNYQLPAATETYRCNLHQSKVKKCIKKHKNNFLPIFLKIRLKGNGGKIAVIGSVHIFSDNDIDKEDNKRWLEDLVEYLTDTKATILDFDRDLDVI
jgi:hypothetical protein